MPSTMIFTIGAVGATLFAIGLATSSGCIRSTEFRCASDSQCTNTGFQGTCEAVGYCSFPDIECETGRRFGELDGPQSGQCVDDAAPNDGGPDALLQDARACFGAGAYELCFTTTPPPTGTVVLDGPLDTTNDPRCAALPASWTAAGQPDACLIGGTSVNVPTPLSVTGTRPLVIVGESVTIGALIDIASHRGGATAAGANSALCVAFGSTPVNDVNGAGGGAGGSFMFAGGDGGRGEATGATGGAAAAPNATAPTVLRGGCPGQLGGTGTAAAGTPGAGGGAIYIAAGRLSFGINGTINASGASGTGGGFYSGGSGGGAGGMVVIHAMSLGLTSGGKLVANGAGGSSGGDSNTDGTAGSDPSSVSITVPAAGGPGGGGGANGGNGFAGVTSAQNGSGAMSNKAGGGGGGGGGYIRVNIALPGVTASPAISLVP